MTLISSTVRGPDSQVSVHFTLRGLSRGYSILHYSCVRNTDAHALPCTIVNLR